MPAVIDACRAGEALAATKKLIVALPAPLCAEVIVTQFAVAPAFHAQSAADVVRATLPVPPAGVALNVVGLKVYWQPLASCTATAMPPIVSVASRAAPGLPATENATLPLPLPEVPLVIVSHG